MPVDTVADLLETRLAVRAAERELGKLAPNDPERKAAEALLRQVRSPLCSLSRVRQP
jgi:hypothetical protein